MSGKLESVPDSQYIKNLYLRIIFANIIIQFIFYNINLFISSIFDSYTNLNFVSKFIKSYLSISVPLYFIFTIILSLIILKIVWPLIKYVKTHQGYDKARIATVRLPWILIIIYIIAWTIGSITSLIFSSENYPLAYYVLEGFRDVSTGLIATVFTIFYLKNSMIEIKRKLNINTINKGEYDNFYKYKSYFVVLPLLLYSISNFSYIMYYFNYKGQNTNTISELLTTVLILSSYLIIISIILTTISKIEDRKQTEIVIDKLDDLINERGSLKEKLVILNFHDFGRVTQKVNELTEKISKQKDLLEDKVKERTSELKLAYEQLKEFDQLKTNFFANVSHEIRTPLTLILTPIESIIDGDFKDEVDINFFIKLYKNATKLLNLINDLLDFSKIEAGKIKLKITEINLQDLIQSQVDLMKNHCMSKNIELNFFTGNEYLPVFADKLKLEKVFINLLSNALKFTPQKGNIEIKIKNNKKNYLISVKDNGIGIPQNKIHKIFDRFCQIENDLHGDFTGTGLGLSIIKEFIEMHNGKITVFSRDIKHAPENHGTEFKITLLKGKEHFKNKQFVEFAEEQVFFNNKKIETPKINSLNYEQPFKQDKEKYGKSLGHKILVVEDNEDMRELINFYLENEYKLSFAENGKIGIEIARKILPDLIITDIMMPVMDGFEMAARIKQDDLTKTIPVLMLTAKANIENKVHGFEYGADDYLTKPFNYKELYARITSLLKINQLQKKLEKANINLHDKVEELLEKERIINNDLLIAKTIQQNILSQGIDENERISTVIKYLPQYEVGGDFYNIFELRKNVFRFFIADATGHGIPAALTTMLIKSEYEKMKVFELEPGIILTLLNETFVQQYYNISLFFSCFIMDIDLENNSCSYASAGHPEMYLKNHNEIISLYSSGGLIGIKKEPTYQTADINIKKGNTIYLFTDGIIEQTDNNNKEFGEINIKNIIQKANANINSTVEKIVNSLLNHAQDEKLSDDIMLIGVEIL